jgi:hypothetical protein
MNDRLIFIGAAGTGKSTAALGFMTKPAETAIIQHKGSAGFRYIAIIPALKDMRVLDAANFADFASQANECIRAKKTLIIIDDYDYLFRDEQRGARLGKQGNEKRLASQDIYTQAEEVVKQLMECGATIIFTCKAVAQSAGKEGNAYVTEVSPFLPGLHAHMETGMVDGVFHFIKTGPRFTAHTRAWETSTGNSITRYYAKATIGIGDYLPEVITITKDAKPYTLAIRQAMKDAKIKMSQAFAELTDGTTPPS